MDTCLHVNLPVYAKVRTLYKHVSLCCRRLHSAFLATQPHSSSPEPTPCIQRLWKKNPCRKENTRNKLSNGAGEIRDVSGLEVGEKSTRLAWPSRSLAVEETEHYLAWSKSSAKNEIELIYGKGG